MPLVQSWSWGLGVLVVPWEHVAIELQRDGRQGNWMVMQAVCASQEYIMLFAGYSSRGSLAITLRTSMRQACLRQGGFIYYGVPHQLGDGHV